MYVTAKKDGTNALVTEMEVSVRVECTHCNIIYGRRKGYAVQCKKCGRWLKSESEKRTIERNPYGHHRRG